MAVSKELERAVLDRLAVAGVVRARRMFGGVGIYVDDAFCGIIGSDSGRLYLKVDDSNRSNYEAEGMKPFETPKGTMSYYPVPEHVFDDPKQLRAWVLEARAVATRAKSG